MASAVELTELDGAPTLEIRTSTPVADLPALIGRNYGLLHSYLGELGIDPVGVPNTAYHNSDRSTTSRPPRPGNHPPGTRQPGPKPGRAPAAVRIPQNPHLPHESQPKAAGVLPGEGTGAPTPPHRPDPELPLNLRSPPTHRQIESRQPSRHPPHQHPPHEARDGHPHELRNEEPQHGP
ncbi:MAG: hypothetical protein QG597_1979 [Actinomycetota bacterium]|nr:hypothetical protein [Actinomycetota bacterium]